ncbi:MAG: hypothetical protein HUK26_07240, partial [Duodenibacillus sp.]|nr:hypothetical protein [Duodenibacillus sp.]
MALLWLSTALAAAPVDEEPLAGREKAAAEAGMALARAWRARGLAAPSAAPEDSRPAPAEAQGGSAAPFVFIEPGLTPEASAARMAAPWRGRQEGATRPEKPPPMPHMDAHVHEPSHEDA